MGQLSQIRRYAGYQSAAILKEAADLLFIDARRYRGFAEKAAYILLAIMIISFTYTSIASRINTLPAEIGYREYSGLGGSFSYKLPETWRAAAKELGGHEIIYHSEYSSPDGRINGFAQVWNLKMPLLNFIKEGQKSAAGVVTYKYYTIEPIKVDGRSGYVLTYSKKGEGRRYTKAFEIFSDAGDSMFVRFAFYMDEEMWKDEYRDFFLGISAMSRLK